MILFYYYEPSAPFLSLYLSLSTLKRSYPPLVNPIVVLAMRPARCRFSTPFKSSPFHPLSWYGL